jgi:predicted DNA-binding WGR domain protein
MIKLTRSDPAQNMHRFYALQLAGTLFGEWVLVAEWGRIGFAGSVKEDVFESETEAQAALSKRLAVKIRRGYRVTSV